MEKCILCQKHWNYNYLLCQRSFPWKQVAESSDLQRFKKELRTAKQLQCTFKTFKHNKKIRAKVAQFLRDHDTLPKEEYARLYYIE